MIARESGSSEVRVHVGACVCCKRTPVEGTIDNFLGSCRDRWDACPSRQQLLQHIRAPITNALFIFHCTVAECTVGSYVPVRSALTAEKSFRGTGKCPRRVRLRKARWRRQRIDRGDFDRDITNDPADRYRERSIYQRKKKERLVSRFSGFADFSARYPRNLNRKISKGMRRCENRIRGQSVYGTISTFLSIAVNACFLVRLHKR